MEKKPNEAGRLRWDGLMKEGEIVSGDCKKMRRKKDRVSRKKRKGGIKEHAVCTKKE